MGRWFKLGAALALACGVTFVACSKGEVGEACDTKGSQDECVEGAICDADNTADAICLKVCESDSDCTAGTQNCNGTTGTSIKACKTK